MTKSTINEQDLSTLFGLDELSDEEKAELLNDIGMTIIESATLRFLAESDEPDGERFESLLSSIEGNEDGFQKVLEEFPRFAEFLNEEAAAFKREALSVLS
ncbi:MAG: hypothetical protein WDZ93_00970 [Candidatus Paceibacterota bacterium]